MNLSFCQEQDRGWNYLKHLFDSFAFGKMSLVGIERIKGVTLSKVGESWREREESPDKRFDLLHLFSISMEYNDCLLCKNVTEEIIKFLFSQQTHSIDMSYFFWGGRVLSCGLCNRITKDCSLQASFIFQMKMNEQ